MLNFRNHVDWALIDYHVEIYVSEKWIEMYQN